MKILIFNAIWCPGCLIMRPLWNKIKREHPNFEIIHYDYDMDNKEILKWEIGKKLPVAIILDNKGHEIKRIIGEKSKKEINLIIEEIVVKQNEKL